MGFFSAFRSLRTCSGVRFLGKNAMEGSLQGRENPSSMAMFVAEEFRGEYGV